MKKRIIFILVVLVALAGGVAVRPKNTVRAEDARVVTVHIDGEDRTIATNATTVKEVLERLGTSLAEHDKTEPALSEEVHGADFTVNVYRARPIAVVD
ncbi:MAG TPA: ubiquitin-like domain-containing protein, partial [Candidatus Saccharibacteria bacterium]|nr:ubiquitin-like domain-containing protein [Candidatus Saccharibacteria bacterium]